MLFSIFVSTVVSIRLPLMDRCGLQGGGVASSQLIIVSGAIESFLVLESARTCADL